MKAPPGLFAGRFRLATDPAAVGNLRRWARKPFGPGFDLGSSLEGSTLWLRGEDTRTGERVLVEPRSVSFGDWADDLVAEATARHVAGWDCPFLARIRHVGDGVVYAEPPPGLPRGSLDRPKAARLALQACEVVGRLHAAGLRPGSFDAMNLRVVEADGGLRIHWLVPGVPDFSGKFQPRPFNPLLHFRRRPAAARPPPSPSAAPGAPAPRATPRPWPATT